MAVKEYWEIKWILWIAVQEDWVTVVSQADTVNIVWWWTVTDVWGVATINIPEWCEWIREDVPQGSATYTFVNAPATDTSFLVFTDSGTLMFLWIDYTYDASTETITFLSLGANEKAYIWIAHASVLGGNVWDMVKAVYDPNNVQQNVYDYNYFINTPTIWNATLKIQKNGTDVNSITMNATSDVTANITVPTTVAELSDASDYVTDTELATTLEDYALTVDVPTKTSELENDSWFITSAWDVYWPNSSVDWNIVVFDGNTGKLIKDSWLNIQVVNTQPSGDLCSVYYDNGTIYLYTQAAPTPDGILLEDWYSILLEDWSIILLEDWVTPPDNNNIQLENSDDLITEDSNNLVLES